MKPKSELEKIMEIKTPHIKANKTDFAKTVLMPGDPLRARFIAENYLDSARLVNNIRGIQGYTGNYRGVPVSVMASGMGMPSMGIYSYELFKFFDVEGIIRVGSVGGIAENVKLRDIIIAMGASTTSSFASQYALDGSFAPICDFGMLKVATEEAERIGASYAVGNVLSSDVFYGANEAANEKWRAMGILGVEMEAAALYMNAAYLGRRALAICTVSDHVFTGEALSSEERQTSFTEMMEIALNTAIRL